MYLYNMYICIHVPIYIGIIYMYYIYIYVYIHIHNPITFSVLLIVDFQCEGREVDCPHRAAWPRSKHVFLLEAVSCLIQQMY